MTTASVRDERSRIRTGLIHREAWLEGDTIWATGLLQRRIGRIDGGAVVVSRGFFERSSEPLVGGQTAIRVGLLREEVYTWSGACAARDIALGVAHIYAIHREQEDSAYSQP